ncbi:MAG: hypothetical protein DRI69_00255 [Bacteroidetes bacterium]|nr:MAG: hypothetical protein DRI69_00255 [Bacteroidota bacterium]
MRKVAEIVLRFRVLIVVMTLLFTAATGYFIKDVKINPDILSYLPDDDEEAMLFDMVGEKYGGNYVALIGLESDDVFDNEVLTHVKVLTDTLRTLDGVSYVTSLTDVIDIKSSEWGVEIGKLVDEYNLPESDEDVRKLKEYTLSKDFYKGVIVSEDATLTLIYVKISEGVDKIEVANNIVAAVESYNYPEKIHFAGLPVMLDQFSKIVVDDLLLVGPLALLIILLVLFFAFRSAAGVILPIVTVIISVTWTVGIMGYLGVEFSLITNIIPIILLAIGSAYTIHVLNRINETEDEDKVKKIEKALAYIIIPVLLASLTTMVGFLSFVFGSYLTMISTFGLFTALGTFFALVLSLTFAPALSAIFLGRKSKGNATLRSNNKSFLTKVLTKLFYTVQSHPKYIVSIWLLVIMISIFGISNIVRKSNMVEYFKKDHTTRVSENLFSEKLGGTLPVYLIVKGNTQSPEVLRMMRKAADFMEGTGHVVNTQSVADMIEEMNDIMGTDGKVIPDREDKIINLWFLIEGQEVLDQMVSPDLDEGMVVGTFTSNDSRVMAEFIAEVNEFIAENDSDNYSLALTGFPSLYKKLDESLVKSQLTSLSIAILLVLLIVSVTFRSLLEGAYAIIPIVSTLVILFGFMGLTGIPLDVATVLVGSICIGIGVDYAIHMISHINNEYKNTGEFTLALQHAVSISGRAIVINVMSVACGFLVLLFSNLVPLQNFGVLVALTMIVSGLGALTLMPAIMVLSKRILKLAIRR